MKVQKSFSDQTSEQGHYVPSEILGPDIIELGKPKDNAGGQLNIGVQARNSKISDFHSKDKSYITDGCITARP